MKFLTSCDSDAWTDGRKCDLKNGSDLVGLEIKGVLRRDGGELSPLRDDHLLP